MNTGNSMADAWEHRHLEGHTCDHCEGRGEIIPNDEKELRAELERLYDISLPPPTFSDLCAIWRDWRRFGVVSCCICGGGGRVYA